MPHLTLDYSANLRADGDFSELCKKLARTLIAQRAGDKPVYPVGGVRVRAFAAEDYCIADDSINAAYVHARLAVGAGRSEVVLKETGDALFQAMKSHFDALYKRQGLALSLEIAEFSEAGTWKHNNLHSLLNKAGQ